MKKSIYLQRYRIRLAALLAFSLTACSMAAHADKGTDESRLFERTSMISPLAQHSLMLDITRAGPRLVAVGERGFVLVSDDESQTWRQILTPVSVTLTRVVFANEHKGWAVGHAGVILHTEDGGLTWQKQLDGEQAAKIEFEAAQQAHQANPDEDTEQRVIDAEYLVADGPDKPFLALHFFDEHEGLAVGAYGLAFATSDGGASWRPIRHRIDNPMGLHLYDIEELNGAVFIAGEQGILLRSDRGGHFTALESPASGSLFGVLAGSGNLVAYGLRGKAYLSEDKGQHWRPVTNNRSANLTSGIRLNDGTLLLVDESGGILSSQDGGQTFKVTTLEQPIYLSGISTLANDQIVLSSTRGLVRPSSANNTMEPNHER